MNGKSMSAWGVVTSILLPLMLVAAPAASALKVEATVEDNSVHVVIDITITIELENVVCEFENYIKEHKPDWEWGKDITGVPEWQGMRGWRSPLLRAKGKFDILSMPSSREEVKGHVENAFKSYP